MNFDLNEEQSLLQSAVTRLLKERYPFGVRRKASASPNGWSRDIWSDFAAQGLLGIGLGDAAGGCGGPVEAMIVGEALGGALSAEPYLATVIMGGTALRLSGGARATEILEQVAAGECLLAVAEGLHATRSGAGWRLSGTARAAVHADCADHIIAVAESEGGAVVTLAPSKDVRRRGYRTLDGLRAADVDAEGCEIRPNDVLASGAQGAALAERVREHAIAYIAAEAVGLMAMLLEASVEHLKTRQQFGLQLSKFQALQHRAVDMLVALEQARSAAIYATAALNVADADERRRSFAWIKLVISNAARLVGQQAVQLHGGVGLTEEHRVGWGLRRLTMIDLAFGDADEQAARLAALGGLVAPV